ncbi:MULTISPECIES: hypothetical protein [Streptomyces]|uniref:Uncharacterized protein n=1 Tax=Streptomyces kaempferi TaxID=333725 RepID=A0ABW3XDY4_9ACTN
MTGNRGGQARLGTWVTTAVCDVRDAERIAEVFDGCPLPGVLVNNAAANLPVPAEDMTPNAWWTVVGITPTETVLMTREFGRGAGARPVGPRPLHRLPVSRRTG